MQQVLFENTITEVDAINNPSTYRGIYSFHKYWGKKPVESVRYFIQNFTDETDIVLDPFLGSGFIARESILLKRRFIGIDINPFSIEHTNFILLPPLADDYMKAFREIENNVKNLINDTYLTLNNEIATHYLWHNDELKQIWTKSNKKRGRIELVPKQADLDKIQIYSDYKVKSIRKISFFDNSRINTKKNMTIYDLFTRRALHNIDLLMKAFDKYPKDVKRALLLSLTASSGQMSNMVFAITNRGKMSNKKSDKIEVGSWVIGYWRPELHFEINVWNCFENKVKKLYTTLKDLERPESYGFESINSLIKNKQGYTLQNDDCVAVMKSIVDRTIKVICTDPPHSDRIPYLEMSEMWNSILNTNVDFQKEIVVSNAKERNKNKDCYLLNMKEFLTEAHRILKDDGFIFFYFNARDKQSWKFLDIVKENNNLVYIGSFPMKYSATSVVQDNREGGMKVDYVLVMQKNVSNRNHLNKFNKIKGWSDLLPKSEV